MYLRRRQVPTDLPPSLDPFLGEDGKRLKLMDQGWYPRAEGWSDPFDVSDVTSSSDPFPKWVGISGHHSYGAGTVFVIAVFVFAENFTETRSENNCSNISGFMLRACYFLFFGRELF